MIIRLGINHIGYLVIRVIRDVIKTIFVIYGQIVINIVGHIVISFCYEEN